MQYSSLENLRETRPNAPVARQWLKYTLHPFNLSNMEFDDEVFPSQLEELLPELREDNPFQNDFQYDSFISSLIGADTDTYKENISVHIRHLLDAVSEDDPLRDNSNSKPRLPSPKGKNVDHYKIKSH